MKPSKQVPEMFISSKKLVTAPVMSLEFVKLLQVNGGLLVMD